jgi:hypothetical protein
MNAIAYNQNKKYLYELKEKSEIAYNILAGKNNVTDKKLIAQNN